MAAFASPRFRSAMTDPLPNANKLLKTAAKSPVYIYRYAISPLIGPRCRHLPTCSQYAIDAIDMNGVWIGGWLTLGRIARCHRGAPMATTPPLICAMPASPFGLPGAISGTTRARKA